jgi:DNA/RNA endonuclease G (NUC1)
LAILNWTQDSNNYYEFTGKDLLDSEIKIFAMRDDGNVVFGYTEINGELGALKKLYALSSEVNPTGEIYYEDASGNKRYYKSNSYEDVESKPISPKKIFATDRGHLAPNADRSRSDKDKIATFLTSNLIPQQSGNNRNIWEGLESHVRDVTKAYPSIDTYVIAGGDAINTSYPIISSNISLNPSITVPQGVWKVVISENRQDSTNLPQVSRFGFYAGNDNRTGFKWDDNTFISSIGTLEGYLNSTYRNAPDLNPNYNFFNHLPTQTANELKSSWIIQYNVCKKKS